MAQHDWRRRVTGFLLPIGAAALLLAGCAAKWSLDAELPAAPVRWLDGDNAPRAEHLMTITGFKETSTTASSLLLFAVFGRSKDENRIARPVAAAVGPDGRIAVADAGCSCVHLYVPAEERYLRLRSAGGREMRTPVGAAFDADGRLYVSDSSRGAIEVFDRAGSHLFSITRAGDGPLRRPTGLTYARDRKVLYAVDTLANKVHAFDAEGKLLFSFGEPGEKGGQLNFPTHIAAGRDGNVHVVDALNFRAQTFDGSGAFLSAFGRHGNGSGDFAMPKGIAVDPSGVLYIVDTLFDNIQLFSAAGEFLFTIGRRGSGPGEFSMPSGLFLAREGTLYVCDTYNQRVQVFRLRGDNHE
jgi:DNA-binding beta-propeller fold protein YncE